MILNKATISFGIAVLIMLALVFMPQLVFWAWAFGFVWFMVWILIDIW